MPRFTRRLVQLLAYSVLPASVLVFAGVGSAEDNRPPSGFVPLFNGKDLTGWYGWGTRNPMDLAKMSPEERASFKRTSIEGGEGSKGDHLLAHWRVENGELVNDGSGLYLTTDRDFGDFELLIDYKMLPRGDSGIYLRGIPQVQIWDWTEESKFKLGADKGSGGLWNNRTDLGKYPAKLADRPFGEWNRFRIRMVGEVLNVWNNGEHVIVDARLPGVAKEGPIALQSHGCPIEFYNVMIQRLD